MHSDNKQDALFGAHRPIDDVKRMHLLLWRFSEIEIARLTTWQLRYRERVELSDLPIDEYHLRFARWLVEHGKLTEELGSEPQTSGTAKVSESMPHTTLSLKYVPAPTRYTRPDLDGPITQVRPRRWQWLSHFTSRAREGVSEFIASLRDEILP